MTLSAKKATNAPPAPSRVTSQGGIAVAHAPTKSATSKAVTDQVDVAAGIQRKTEALLAAREKMKKLRIEDQLGEKELAEKLTELKEAMVTQELGKLKRGINRAFKPLGKTIFTPDSVKKRLLDMVAFGTTRQVLSKERNEQLGTEINVAWRFVEELANQLVDTNAERNAKKAEIAEKTEALAEIEQGLKGFEELGEADSDEASELKRDKVRLETELTELSREFDDLDDAVQTIEAGMNNARGIAKVMETEFRNQKKVLATANQMTEQLSATALQVGELSDSQDASKDLRMAITACTEAIHQQAQHAAARAAQGEEEADAWINEIRGKMRQTQEVLDAANQIEEAKAKLRAEEAIAEHKSGKRSNGTGKVEAEIEVRKGRISTTRRLGF